MLPPLSTHPKCCMPLHPPQSAATSLHQSRSAVTPLHPPQSAATPLHPPQSAATSLHQSQSAAKPLHPLQGAATSLHLPQGADMPPHQSQGATITFHQFQGVVPIAYHHLITPDLLLQLKIQPPYYHNPLLLQITPLHTVPYLLLHQVHQFTLVLPPVHLMLPIIPQPCPLNLIETPDMTVFLVMMTYHLFFMRYYPNTIPTYFKTLN